MEWDICPPWWRWPWPGPWPGPDPWPWREQLEKVDREITVPRDGEIAVDMFRSLTVLAISHTMTGDAAVALRRQAIDALNGQMKELNELGPEG